MDFKTSQYLNIRLDGFILPTVLFFLLLFSAVGTYLAHSSRNAIGSALINREEMEQRTQMHAQILEFNLRNYAEHKLVVGMNDKCQRVFFDEEVIIQRIINNDLTKVQLNEKCHHPYVKRLLVQNWFESDGVVLKSDIYEENPLADNCLQIGWCYSVETNSDSNNALTVWQQGEKASYYQLHIDYKVLPEKDEEPSRILKVERISEKKLGLLDSYGRLWVVEGECPLNLNFYDLGEVPKLYLTDEEKKSLKLIDRFLYSFQNGVYWDLFWLQYEVGDVNVIADDPVLYHARIDLAQRNELLRYQLVDIELENVMFDDFNIKTLHMQRDLASISDSWRIELKEHKYLRSIQKDQLLYMVTVKNSEKWSWFLARDGSAFIDRTSVAFSKKRKGVVKLAVCSASLRSVVMDNEWQVGCDAKAVKNLRFIY